MTNGELPEKEKDENVCKRGAEKIDILIAFVVNHHLSVLTAHFSIATHPYLEQHILCRLLRLFRIQPNRII